MYMYKRIFGRIKIKIRGNWCLPHWKVEDKITGWMPKQKQATSGPSTFLFLGQTNHCFSSSCGKNLFRFICLFYIFVVVICYFQIILNLVLNTNLFFILKKKKLYFLNLRFNASIWTKLLKVQKNWK